jgi:hypothetical protein
MDFVREYSRYTCRVVGILQLRIITYLCRPVQVVWCLRLMLDLSPLPFVIYNVCVPFSLFIVLNNILTYNIHLLALDVHTV